MPPARLLARARWLALLALVVLLLATLSDMHHLAQRLTNAETAMRQQDGGADPIILTADVDIVVDGESVTVTVEVNCADYASIADCKAALVAAIRELQAGEEPPATTGTSYNPHVGPDTPSGAVPLEARKR